MIRVPTCLLLHGLLAAVPVAAAAPCFDHGRIRYEARSFFGHACEADCAAEKAGFAWAERHGIAAADDCIVAVPSHRNGCRAYAGSGRRADVAGYDWALENELTDPCLCDGAGDGFRAGCLGYIDEAR